MKKIRPYCALCGQPVRIKGFIHETPAGLKHFCCEGCLSIFQLLNPEPNSNQPKSEKIS